ncbi:DUF1345 domain-containing protein [Massilia sp. TS11]|uniref:DUF1345 domain-containing protein n=1 Tax=Massilia sp. TS11 TaxID=2908003 RepID=UPI001EDC2B35|nr:DUF1345 domain-containing protein [Massilia sp. TS11]MCG2585723.1 DUF1345 domain-containing protein [Massilia sp. TS11]
MRRLSQFLRHRPHLSMAIGIGALVAVFAPAELQAVRRALVAWDAAVWFYLLSMVSVVLRTDPERVRATAVAQDEAAGLVLVSLTAAAVASLTAIVSELTGAAGHGGAAHAHYLFAALTVSGSWFLLGVVFAFHYAHLYYRPRPGPPPLRFPDTELAPDYWDFLYFSFTVLVAAQTADVGVASRALRRVVMVQSILSFFFNLSILGLSVNIAASLLNG